MPGGAQVCLQCGRFQRVPLGLRISVGILIAFLVWFILAIASLGNPNPIEALRLILRRWLLGA